MSASRVVVWVLASAVLAGRAIAQERDVRSDLVARGAPADFVARVGDVVDAARAQGLPVGPLAEKAVEGWAKHVPVDRVVPALEQVRARLVEGRRSAVAGGLADPPGPVVAAAGEALGRGMTPDDVRGLVAAAPTPEDAAAGLAVAASLCAQGLERRAAVRAVQGAYGQGSGPEHLFELPSAVADMTGRGMPMSDVARRIMQGGGLPLPPTAGPGQGQGRPGTIPPTPGGKKGTGAGRRQ